MRTVSLRCIRQSSVPVGEQRAQFVAESEQFLDASVQLFEAITHQILNTEARRAAFVPYRKHSFQVSEGKADDERPLNEQHAFSTAVLVTRGRSPCRS